MRAWSRDSDSALLHALFKVCGHGWLAAELGMRQAEEWDQRIPTLGRLLPR